MKSRRSSVICVGALLAAGTAVILRPHPDATSTSSTVKSHARGGAEAVHSSAGQPGNPQTPATESGTGDDGATAVTEANAPAANGQGDFGTWAYEKPREPDFAKLDAFDGWMAQWKKATPEEREALAKEGARLAGDRRPEYKALISFDPRQAVDRAVTRVQRQDLPEEITSQLETPVSATGTYNVYGGRPAPGMDIPVEALTMRYFEANGVSYKAHVPDELKYLTSLPNTPLQGYADGREFAVAPNAVRALDVGEKIPEGSTVQSTCPVSGKTTESVSTGEAVTQESPTVQIGENIITLCNGSHVAVLEDNYRTYVQASGSGGGGFFMDNFPGTSSRSIGAFKCLYIRAIYQEQTSPPNTEESAYNDMRNNARYYIESSYGKMVQTTTFTPLITLPHTQKWYIDKDSEVNGLGLVHNDSRAAAKALGYDPGQFDCIIVRVNGGPRLGGTSWGGGSSVWVSWDGMDVLNHECGHSLGLNHANSWDNTDGTGYGTGSNGEYGNPYDVMGGSGGFSAHYNTISKRQLGWLQPNYYHSPKGNGLYRIYAYDQPQLEEGKRYAINVPKDSIRGYNIEYHPARGGLLADQALVLYNGMGSNAGHIIDTTQGTPSGKSDAGIGEGRTYSDWESDQHFTVVAENATTPPSLDVVYNRGPFPGNIAPTATLGASVTTIAVGGSVTFTATASDANGDPLAYYWQFDDGVYGTNNAVFTRTFNAAAQVNAMLTVSDMKGGTVRRSVVINVGSHGKQQITGTITDGANPLAGVMVGNGSKYAFTNADGTYSLPGLSTGSTTLTASLPGYTFTPSTANPYTVVAGTNTVNWTSTAPTLVTLTKTADATEGGSNGNFRLTRTGDTSADLVVLVSPVGGTATMTTDYTFTPAYVASGSFKSFTIPAGSATLDVAVAAVNDTAAEGPETITLQLASSAGYVSGSSNSVVMTLNDNDTTLPLVAVTAPDPYATEGPGSTDTGKFTFTRTGSTAAALNLTVAWSGAATNGTDYTTLPTTVTIPAGQSSADVVVSPINDSAIEAPEDVVATISTNAAYLRDAGATTASVIITDDDTPVVTVSVPDPNASEGGQDTGTFLLTRTGSTAAPLTVYYGLTGTASYGTDYMALTGQGTIPAGATSAPVVITPYDDDIGEPAETVVLSLSTFNNAYSIGSAYQGTVTITDNNDPVLVTVRAGTVGTEGGSNATLIFHTIGTGSGNVTVNYTVGGTATAGSDYTALSGTVSVPVNGSNDTTVTIPITNDTLAEPTETIVVTITPGSGYKVYNDPSATALIRDNDSGGERVMVSTWNQTPTEAGPTAANFYFSRAVGTTGDLTVNYTVSGTATNGTDYANLSGTCVIPDGASGVSVPVTPVDDAIAEGIETVTVTVASGTGYSVDFPASATFEITDNDTLPVTVGFQQTAISTSEQPGALGEYRDLPVVLSASSTNTVTVRVIAGGGDAMGDDVDWAFVDAASGNAVIPYATLTFAPGVTSKNVRIRVKNDGYVEGGETAVLQLTAATNAGITAGKSTENVLIFDDQIPALVTEERWNTGSVYTNNTWNSVTPDYTGLLESFTTAQDVADSYSRRLTGLITAPTTGNYTFWIASDDASRLYLSTDATAANKVQIATVSGWTGFQDWDANASQKSVTKTLTAGQSYYMEVQHQEGGGGDHVSVAWEGPGFTRTPIVSPIADTAPRTVRMLTAATTRTEGDGSEPMLQVLLDRPAGSTPVTVNYDSTGTATNGSDYTLTAGTLTFNNGEQMKAVPLAILTDAIGESPEGIVVSLSSPSGATLSAPSSTVITLLDASAPVVNTIQVNASSAMSVGTVVGTATATPASGRTISGWTIVAGNESGAFAINASGQVTLQVPGSLPNPGLRHLVVRAIDNAGATGDGSFKVVCNPPSYTGVSEKRFAGATAYNTNTWTGTPSYTGTLEAFTTPQNVADSYSRQIIGYIQPPTTGDYTFWIASDDASRLYLSTDETAANKSQIATVSGYTGFQSWDAQTSQKSATFTLTAGRVYYLEVQHQEGGGGDHVSVAWQGPGFGRAAIPIGAVAPPFPTFIGVNETRFAGSSAYDTGVWTGTPSYTGTLTTFTSIQDVGDNYSRKLTGCIRPATTGDYTFWIASDDASRLYLSTDETAANKSQIATVTSYTGYQSWDSNPSQQSAAITLTAGKAYYLEVQHQEGGGGDHVSVAWQGPGISRAAIPSSVVDPQFPAAPVVPSINVGAPLAGSSIASGTNVTVSANVVATGVPVTSVEFYVDGALVGSDGSAPYSITWTNNATVGSHNFTAKAIYSVGSVTSVASSFTVPNAAPTFTANPITGGGATEDSAYSGSIASYGADINPGDTLTYSKVSGPSWLSIASNGALSGTPLNGDVGANSFTVKVTDAAGANATTTLNIAVANVNDAPTFTANPITGGGATEDSAYSGSIASYGSDIDVGDTLTYSKVSGPSWLSVASNGALSGTPGNSDVGANAFTVKVTDAAGANVSATLNIAVTNTNDAPTFTANPITGGGATEDSTYSGSIASYGSDIDAGDTLTYSKVSGPSWLSVASNGALSGTPGNSDVGANSFTVKVTDAAGANVSATLNIAVTNTNDAPVFTTNPITGAGATEAAAYTGSIASYGSDIDVGDTLTYTKVSGPSWLSVSSNGDLSGTPTATDGGLNTFSVKVTDASGANATTTLNVTVTLINNDGVWTLAGSGSWPTTGNWSGGVFANGTGKTADFSTLNLTSDATVTVDGARTIGNLTFGDTTPSNNWIVNTGTGGPLTLDVASGSPSVTVNNQTATIGAVVAGTKGLTKAGSGTLVLNGANTYTGATAVNAGTLVIGNSNQLNAGSSSLTIGTTGTVQLNAGASGTYPGCGITVNGAGTSATTGLYLNTGVYHNAQAKITLATAPTTVRTAGAGTAQIGGFDINGTMIQTNTAASGSVIASTINIGGGSYGVNFSTTAGSATSTGDLIVDGNLLNVGIDGFGIYFNGTGSVLLTGASPSFTNNNRNKLTVNTGTLILGGSSTFAGGSYGGSVVLGSSGKLKYDRSAGAQTFSGVISGNGSLTKSNSGTLTLGGTNTYTGTTTVSGGSLVVNGAVSTGAVTVQTGATLGGSGTVGGATTVQSGATFAPAGTLTVNNTLSLAGTTQVTLGKSGVTLSNDKVAGVSTVTYGGLLVVTNVGPDALVVGNSFQLFAASTYSGSFSSITLPTLPAGLVWDTTNLGVNGTLFVGGVPLAVNDSFTTAEDAMGTFAVMANDSDPDGDTISLLSVTQGAHGTVAISGSNVTYTPAADYNGSDSFTYTITDSSDGTATATVSVTVTPVNDAPTFTANPITGSGATEDSAYSGSIASYGADIDAGDTLTYSKVSGPSWLSVASDGALSGTPLNGDVGANAFTVKVTDAAGANATTTLNITVTNTNDAPTFTANPITGAGATEDSAYSGSIASYGADVDAGDTLTYSKVSGPAWLSVASDGALSGTPDNSNVGANAFTVKVTDAAGANATTALNITVANTNDAPTFATTLTAPDATSGMPYTGSSIAGSASDVDAGDTLAYSKVSGPSWLVVASNGTLTGTPGLADGGTANVFTVRATDGTGAYAETTLTINVIIPDLAADPDGDGSPTGLEFTVGTAPFDVASVPGSIYTNLRGWWKLDETSGTNADDATGRVQDGTIAGSPASTTGIVGNALNLDGTDDGITLGAAPSLSGTGDFTVGAWVKIAPGSGTGVIIQQRDATGSGYNGEYGLQVLSNGTVEFYIYNNGYQFDIVTPATYGLVNDNQWHHVAATRSGTTGTVYVDGNPLATASGTAKSLVSTITMSIGWDQRDNNRRFKGLLDEVRLYTRALSASELNGLHDGLIANRAPAFTASSFTMGNATVGSAYSGSLVGKATDADTDVLTFAKVSGPSWLTIASNGALSGTPAAGDAGAGSYSVSVTDPDGQSATATMSITVYGALPSGWTAGDIGNTTVAGSSGYTSGSGLYTISGGGPDIWGTADTFQYASTAMTGDGEIRARVTSQTNTAGWAKAGVMMRDTTAAGSSHSMMVVTPSNGFANQYRATTGASSSHIAGPGLNAYPNNWVRVTRCGSLFTAYVSSNGTTWTQVGQETVTMGGTIRVGLAVDAGTSGVASTATFDNVTVTPYPSPWVTGDIGTTGVAGRSEFFNNVHTLNGAGVVGGTADGFRYTYQALTADGDITVRIPTFANTGTSSRIGVMIRDTLAVDARHVFLGTDGSGAFTWTRRTATAGSTTTSNSGTATAPNVWVRLTRVGNDITAYSSTNGTSWTNVGTVTVTMAGNCYIGLAVGSGNTTGLNASTFDSITVTP
ncbi:tandem-95 repeat protein [Luteolibacter ambystomatis]|uniref:Tandem-95 repeat protein n=2 Tax=Luteolibacter ambystomatis TaxID=2824561 RepID=A0A975J202_9BACT|nr:putative Ig domain-containing protein [Luteolibacter ambystomatis]QUE52573.1 tandem-95 repeat protein [Luteolibacter ambystomatis]